MKKPRDVDYSSRERELLIILKRSKKRMTTTELIERVFEEEAPFNARQSILSTMTNLSRKVKARRERFSLRKSRRRGPRPVSFWIEHRT